jgi:undecaprenyl-diphosphatase
VRNRQSANLYVCACVCALLFAVLAIMVDKGRTIAFDTTLRNHIHAWAIGSFTETAQVLSLVGSARFWVPGLVVALAALWICGQRKTAWGLALVMIGAVLLDNGLKAAFHRVRPEPFFGTTPDTFSFPSGHAIFGLCFYGALAAILTSQKRRPAPRLAIWSGALILVLAIGMSRIYLGVHYPTDVLAGFFAGGAWLLLVSGTGLLRAQTHA